MDFFEIITRYAQVVSWSDFVDIGLMAFIIYRLMLLLRDTSAERLVKGIFVYFIILQVAGVLQLNTIHTVLESALTFGTTALLIVFQPELRRALEQMGKGHIHHLITSNEGGETVIESAINQTVLACEAMSWTRTGVLMVFERTDKLSEIAKTGTRIDAEPSSELIKNVFYPKSPLHDGAMIVREGRLLSAGCVLPLSANQGLSRDLGTRHRAAVGMSESADAVLVVVSEETGAISVAIGGMLKRHLTPETLRRILIAELMPDADLDAKNKTPWGKLRGWVLEQDKKYTAKKSTTNLTLKKESKTDKKESKTGKKSNTPKAKEKAENKRKGGE